MTKRHRAAGVLLIAYLACAVSAPSQSVKIGSLAPPGSPWDDNLRKLAAEWARLSEGAVSLTVYAGGVAGDESDMIRKMRIGQLSAGLLTVSGLNLIYSGMLALSLPFLIESDGELACVLEEIKPFFEQKLADKGFVVLGWTLGGWVYFFAKNPVITPDDLRAQRFWVWDADEAMVEAWQELGFVVSSLPSTDLLVGLQTGMIEALATSPLIAASNQWFGVASHMSDMKYAPLYGALVVSRAAWRRIPEFLHEPLRAAAQDVCTVMSREVTTVDGQARRIMQEHGLEIHLIPEATRREWQLMVRGSYGLLIGRSFDAAAYDRIIDALSACRRGGRE